VVDDSAWLNALKQLLLLFSSHAYAGVADHEVERDRIVGKGVILDGNSHDDFPFFGELDCVPDKVKQYLAQPERVAHKPRRRVTVNHIDKKS
jgi:hypothetical protein